MRYTIKITALLFCCLVSFSGFSQLNNIIPTPQSLKQTPGNFIWSRNTVVKTKADASFVSAKNELIAEKENLNQGKVNTITIIQDKSIANAEGYRITITPQAITLSASNVEGAYWAISTLKQLAGTSLYSKAETRIPCVEITDAPKYHWRGLHIDVSRHFFDMAYLHKTIDRMVLYKFNKLHLHLSDDQGWRIEIKKYPELTEKGAWRTVNTQDSVCLDLAKTNPNMALPEKHFKTINGKRMYGGFYTQAEMKEFIQYAQSHGVEIIPEIDMPGHMMAAIQQFPWLTASKTLHTGGNFSEPICPCKESTYTFAENVFSEIADLFPSKYIHLGADEVKTESWESLPECKELMEKERIKDVHQLQSYFVRRMEKFFNSKGKKLIGWDEILKGGAPKTATVAYWRAWVPAAPKNAALNGNEMILLPGEYCYFDFKQDANSLKKVLSFNPDMYGLTDKEKELILGVQAAVWTEYIPTEKQFEYMVFPRLLAMSENAWATTKPSWDVFSAKVNTHYQIMDALGINYRMPDLSGFSPKSVFVDKTSLNIVNPLKWAVIRYTTDGTVPNKTSNVYTGSLEINRPQEIKLVAFRPNGTQSEPYSVDYKQQNYNESASLIAPQKGLKFSYYPKFYKSVTKFHEKDKADSAITPAIEIPIQKKAGSFGTSHEGYFYAAKEGIYTFYLKADDGANLYIDTNLLIDNDAMHSAVEKSAQVALKKGYHPFSLKFVEGGGGYVLTLEYETEDVKRKAVTAEDFFH